MSAPMTEVPEEVLEYLDALRISGVTNMYGARPYVQEEFDLDKATAGKYLSEWMLTFSERHPHQED